MTEQEEKKKGKGVYYVVGAIVIVFVLIWAFVGNDNNGTTYDTVPRDTDIFEPDGTDTTDTTDTTEGGLAENLALIYCEEQGGEYTSGEGATVCIIRTLKKSNVFPWFIEGLEAGGLDCDNPEIDPETDYYVQGSKVNCYKVITHDAFIFWEDSQPEETAIEVNINVVEPTE